MKLKTYYNSGKWDVFSLCQEQDKDAYFHDSNIMLEALPWQWGKKKK